MTTHVIGPRGEPKTIMMQMGLVVTWFLLIIVVPIWSMYLYTLV